MHRHRVSSNPASGSRGQSTRSRWTFALVLACFCRPNRLLADSSCCLTKYLVFVSAGCVFLNLMGFWAVVGRCKPEVGKAVAKSTHIGRHRHSRVSDRSPNSRTPTQQKGALKPSPASPDFVKSPQSHNPIFQTFQAVSRYLEPCSWYFAHGRPADGTTKIPPPDRPARAIAAINVDVNTNNTTAVLPLACSCRHRAPSRVVKSPALPAQYRPRGIPKCPIALCGIVRSASRRPARSLVRSCLPCPSSVGACVRHGRTVICTEYGLHTTHMCCSPISIRRVLCTPYVYPH